MTIKFERRLIFVSSIVENFKLIAFTHKRLPFELIGRLHIDLESQKKVLPLIKAQFQFRELLYLSTCNRIEFMVLSEDDMGNEKLSEILSTLNPDLTAAELQDLVAGADYYAGKQAVEHTLKVASSLESLVVGEREIITQVRKAFEHCNDLGLTGDFFRLLIRHTIETAKDIYTSTQIARNPVSVASLAYRQLRDLGIRDEARIVFVGAGETNTTLASYFKKHQFANFTVFNRSVENAEKLATTLNAKAFGLPDVLNYSNGFDVLIVCTGSSEAIIDQAVFKALRKGESGRKVIIDLSIPANVTSQVACDPQVHYIDINSIRQKAEINLQRRKSEIIKCEEIINNKIGQFQALCRERRVELAFSEVPKQVKAIKELALKEVFAKEIGSLDQGSKAVLEKVLVYMEKKYNAVAIKTAKEAFLNTRA
ncbi:MAG TPA: glutamyl-tRNA reductase [Bacteroidia bacterium]|nr:glutamyl-tRNA reductase [Bacteroidia bacterium]